MDDKYLKIAGNIHLSYFIAAADKLGIKYEIMVPNMTARFEFEGKHWFINNTVVPINNAPSSRLAKTKHLTNLVLSLANVPVPHQERINSEIEAISFFGRYKNIVLKPAQNLGGKGVSVLPKTENEVIQSYKYAKENDKKERVLGEEFIEGDNYRLLVLDDKVISVIKRNPAQIIGNGKDSISKLIELENKKRQDLGLMPISIDKELSNKLETQQLTFESIPEEGKVIMLRSNANMTTGGTTEELTQEVDQYYKDLAISATKALDLEYAGVDLITPDITKQAKCAINEVNYNPGLRLHYKITKGEPKDVALEVLEYIKNKYINK